MNERLTEIRDQLEAVYTMLTVVGRPGRQQVTFAEDAFAYLNYLADILPGKGATELVYRLSESEPAIKIAQIYNVMIWSAGNDGTIDAEEIQSWFYGRIRKKIEIASQVDLFPSNSMDESERILEVIKQKFPEIDHLTEPLVREVRARKQEEKAWSDYRKETFAMPREMTPGILNIIKDIKG